MENITSLFDLFNRAKTDGRYRKLAVMAYEDYYGFRGTFNLAKQWFGSWAEANVRHNKFGTCRGMVDYVNTFIPRVEAGELPMGE